MSHKVRINKKNVKIIKEQHGLDVSELMAEILLEELKKLKEKELINDKSKRKKSRKWKG